MESEAKDELLIEKRKRNLPLTFKPTDIIPIVNRAWNRSFAKADSNRRAIVDRGWYPCNYNLLTKPEVLRTKPNSLGDPETVLQQETAPVNN